MPTLYDLLTGAQGGQAIDSLARQFNLSDEQAREAVDALTPAFSQGLKQTTSDPNGFGALLQALATGGHQNYYQDPAAAFSEQGQADGNGILGHLFGSKDVSRAVAAQASQATGISESTLKQMLPALASMVMGGLFSETAGQASPARPNAAPAGGFGDGGGNILGDLIKEMMRQGGQQQSPTRQTGRARPQADTDAQTNNPIGDILKDILGGATQTPGRPQTQADTDTDAQSNNPIGDILKDILGGATQQQTQPRSTPQGSDPAAQNPLGQILKDILGGALQQQTTPQTRRQTDTGGQNPFGDNPLGKIFEEMMRGGQQAEQPTRRQTGQRPQSSGKTAGSRTGSGKTGSSRTSGNPYDEVFGQLRESGSKQGEDYQKGVESIFDQYKRGLDRFR